MAAFGGIADVSARLIKDTWNKSLSRIWSQGMDGRITNTSPTDGHVQVRIPAEGDWQSFTSERVWCEPCSEGLFRVRNIPFYAYGLSIDDLVRVELDADGLLNLHSVASRSGHHVYRCLVTRENPGNAANYLEELNALNCWYETAVHGEIELYAIDVPHDVDVHAVYRVLENGEKDKSWVFEEANFIPPIDP